LLAIGNLFQSFAEGFTAPMVDAEFSVEEAPLIQGRAVRTVESHSVSNEIEVSIVIPCLNEAEIVGICVEKAPFNGSATKGFMGKSFSPTTVARTDPAKLLNLKVLA
jgi:hypothetical protein